MFVGEGVIKHYKGIIEAPFGRENSLLRLLVKRHDQAIAYIS